MAQEQSTHSPTGASSMERWAACPGSVTLCKNIPSTQSEYAQEGTIAHEHAANWLRSGVEPKIADVEMRDAVGTYVTICQSYYSVSHQELGAVRGIEHRFDLSKIYRGCFGTADYWVYWPWLQHLVVLDFKYGAGIFVDAVNNLQAQYYALGVLNNFRFNVKTIEIGIVQPRCMADGIPLRTWTIDSMDLLDFRTTLIDCVKRTEDPLAPLVPGAHCRFCPAASKCPELSNRSMEVAKLEFSPVKAHDPVTLKRALDSREFVKAWLKALDEFAYRELEAGRQIPGYKLVEKRAIRKWDDPELVRTTLQAAGFSDKAIFDMPTVKSPAQMEKVLPKTYGKLIEELCSKTPNGHVVVTDDDPRPSIKPSAVQEFTKVVFNPFGE